MSHVGKLLRGLKWHNFRNLEGIYHPDILENTHKMEEIKVYLDFIKQHDPKKVGKLLEKYMHIDLSNPRNKEIQMDTVAKEIQDIPLIKKNSQEK